MSGSGSVLVANIVDIRGILGREVNLCTGSRDCLQTFQANVELVTVTERLWSFSCLEH